jgi:hypothetical protein
VDDRFQLGLRLRGRTDGKRDACVTEGLHSIYDNL